MNPYLKLLRIKDWRAYFLIALFSFVIAKGYLFSLRDVLLFWVIIFLFFGFAFSINDCFDTKEDKYHHEKENPIVSKKLTFKKGLFFSIGIGILGLSLSLIFGLRIFLLSLLILFLGFFYSAPPLRFKEKPFLDLISHGFFAGAFIFIFALVFFNSNLNNFHYLVAFSIFYLSLLLELRNHLEDYPSDSLANLTTTVCFLGPQKSEKILRYLTIFFPLSFFPIFLLFFERFLFFFFFIFTLIFLLFFLSSQEKKLGKNFRIFDIYTIFCFLLILLAHFAEFFYVH